MVSTQDLSCGKMSLEHSRQTKARTSEQSSKVSARSKMIKLIFLDMRSGRMPEKSWQTITQSHGGFLTHSTGEFPNEESVSTLSQILQVNVPGKYYLSQRACLGILRRAAVRGKELPRILKTALERQAQCV